MSYFGFLVFLLYLIVLLGITLTLTYAVQQIYSEPAEAVGQVILLRQYFA